MGLINKGVKKFFLGANYGEVDLQKNRFKEAMFELRDNYKYILMAFEKDDKIYKIDKSYDIENADGACFCTIPTEERKNMIILSHSMFSMTQTLYWLNEIGVTDALTDKMKYCLDIRIYLTGGDYGSQTSPFDIVKIIEQRRIRFETYQNEHPL